MEISTFCSILQIKLIYKQPSILQNRFPMNIMLTKLSTNLSKTKLICELNKWYHQKYLVIWSPLWSTSQEINSFLELILSFDCLRQTTRIMPPIPEPVIFPTDSPLFEYLYIRISIYLFDNPSYANRIWFFFSF